MHNGHGTNVYKWIAGGFGAFLMIILSVSISTILSNIRDNRKVIDSNVLNLQNRIVTQETITGILLADIKELKTEIKELNTDNKEILKLLRGTN